MGFSTDIGKKSREYRASPVSAVLRERANIELLHLLMYALIFLKAQLWSPSIKVLQKSPTAYEIKNKSLGGSFKVFHNMTTPILVSCAEVITS